MSDAAPAAGAAAEEKKPLLRRLRRPPTALLVTLLGIVLTAWLLPAVTRQWNDRQSAHTLQAGIVSDMAAATARVLQGGDALWISVPTCGSSDNNNVLQFGVPPLTHRMFRCFLRYDRSGKLTRASAKIDKPWSLASAEIEARMRAYLSPRVVTAWQLFSWLMGAYDGSRETHTTVVQAQLDFLAAAQSGFDLQAAAARDTGAVLKAARREGIGGVFDHDVRYRYRLAFARLKEVLRSDDAFSGPTRAAQTPPPEFLSGAFGSVAIALSGFEQEIARAALNSHVTGYSTTTHDLIHDLIP